jgi:hypothetical protein
MRTLLGLALALCTAPLAAQQASAYVPLDHWAMPYIEHLIAAGVMTDPTPLTRPLREADVVRALREVDTLTASAAATETVRRLLKTFARDEEGPRYRVNGTVGLAAATYARRDPLAAVDSAGPRQSGPKHGYVSGGASLELSLGPVVAVTHPYFDTRLKYDPDWFGKKDRKIAGRTAESYVSAQWRFGEVFFGRLDRNWGPSGIQGILLSDDPYGLDHLGIVLGTPRVQLQAVATQLDDRTDSTGATVHRYMGQHRLWIRPSDRWTFALWEASVLSDPGRQFEPWYLNFMNLGLLEQLNTGTNVNSFVGLDFERHGDVTVFGQFMLDDIQVDRRAASDQKPISYAFTLGTKGRIGAGAAWHLFYTQVSNLAYRNENNLQVPLYHFLGTGRNFDDYDQATLKIALLPRAGLLLTPEITLLRQGEGDPRLPHPPVSAYNQTATILQGVVERTLRAAVSGNYAPGGRVGFQFDAGLHRINNYLHTSGAQRTKFIGSVALTYRFATDGKLP